MPESNSRLVPAVDRAARVLGMLEESAQPLSISDLARRLDASKGSVREVLETLRHHGFVARDDDSKLYQLGRRLIRLGALARSRVSTGVAAMPFLKQLADESGEAALLLLVQEERLVISEKAEPENRIHPMTVVAQTGASIPLLAGACGKVVLAYGVHAAEQAAEAAQVAGVPSVLTVSEEELAAVRAQGYALDDGEYLDGIRGTCAPVFDASGEVVGLLLVSGLAVSMRRENLDSIGRATGTAARGISEALGAPIPASPAEAATTT